jgi:hypothetical protein
MLDALELYTAWLEAQALFEEIEEEVMSLFRGNDGETTNEVQEAAPDQTTGGNTAPDYS